MSIDDEDERDRERDQPDDREPARTGRGFFGRARDLLARVVERGLHLPDAAERIRAAVFEPPPPPRAQGALATVTLAEIYLAQGHREKAIATLERVLEREPDRDDARALLARLEGAPEEAAVPVMAPEPDETRPPPPPSPQEIAAAESAAAAEFVADARDACVAVRTAPTSLWVYWNVSPATKAYAERAALQIAPSAQLVLRVLIVEPSWDGPETTTRDLAVSAASGDLALDGVPAGAVVRVGVGVVCDEGYVPIAHSAAYELPRDAAWPPPATALVRRTARGAEAVAIDDSDAPALAHALAQASKSARGTGVTTGDAAG